MKKQAGFTLVELVVALGIIGILLSIAVPLYGSYIERANRRQVMGDLENAAQTLEKYRSVRFTYTGATATTTGTIPPQSPANGTAKYNIAFSGTPTSSYTLFATKVGGTEVFGINSEGKKCYKKAASVTSCNFGTDPKWEDAD